MGVVLIVHLVARLLQKLVEGMMLGVVNKLLGGMLYVFLALVLWSSLLWIGGKMNIIAPETINASRSYSWCSKLAPWFFEQAGKLLPFVKDTFDKLSHFFDTVNQKIPADVGAH